MVGELSGLLLGELVLGVEHMVCCLVGWLVIRPCGPVFQFVGLSLWLLIGYCVVGWLMGCLIGGMIGLLGG